MIAQRIGWSGMLARGVPALATMALVAGVFTGVGQASAAAHSGGMRPAKAGRTAASGVISTVAGGVGGPGKATSVALPSACGTSFAGGFLYIADGNAMRKVSPGTDQLTTLAGTEASGPLGDGGPATSASVGTCAATADAAGNLVIADGTNDRVRVVAKGTGTFYGQAMTAGDIYTVAGDGTPGFSGDGGPATSAEFNFPPPGVQVQSGIGNVAVDGAGDLIINDTGNNRVRKVTGQCQIQPWPPGWYHIRAYHWA